MANTLKISVESVIPLSASQTRELQSLLKQKFGTEAYESKINPKLLGGLRITVGSTQFDATVLGKLAQLRQA